MTDNRSRPEVWLRGPIDGVPTLLQPVAHALAQAVEEVTTLLSGFDDVHLWTRPFGTASVGFHLQHLTGVLDRLTTYARCEPLTVAQLDALRREGVRDPSIESVQLVAAFAARVDATLTALRAVDPSTLSDARTVGRAGLPSTVLGLLVHAAEHTMRHVGQLLVTVHSVTRTATSESAPDV